MKKLFLVATMLPLFLTAKAQTNTFPQNGNVGIGTLTPNSKLVVLQNNTGVTLEPGGNPYFGIVSFNRDALTGNIFDPTGSAFQINNGGPTKNLHFQVYSGNGWQITGNALVISAGNGDIGIGVDNPTEKLSVNGKIRAKEIKIEIANWPDYVFDNAYQIPSLLEIEKYIKANRRLPDMPSAKDVQANGIELGEMNKLLLKKIEELTLLMIEQKKELDDLKTKIIAIEKGH